jgi:hypothetical protein
LPECLRECVEVDYDQYLESRLEQEHRLLAPAKRKPLRMILMRRMANKFLALFGFGPDFWSGNPGSFWFVLARALGLGHPQSHLDVLEVFDYYRAKNNEESIWKDRPKPSTLDKKQEHCDANALTETLLNLKTWPAEFRSQVPEIPVAEPLDMSEYDLATFSPDTPFFDSGHS